MRQYSSQGYQDPWLYETVSNNDTSLICFNVLSCIYNEYISFTMCTDHLTILICIFKVIFTVTQPLWDSRFAVLLLCVSGYICFFSSNISAQILFSFFRADNNNYSRSCVHASFNGRSRLSADVILRKKLYCNFCFHLLPCDWCTERKTTKIS